MCTVCLYRSLDTKGLAEAAMLVHLTDEHISISQMNTQSRTSLVCVSGGYTYARLPRSSVIDHHPGRVSQSCRSEQKQDAE